MLLKNENNVNKKIYDCFCYFNEDRLLQLRLETLWDYVDYFVIVESAYTFSGNPKKINFDLEKFKKYRAKIRYFLIDNYPFYENDPWKNERYQRNYLINGLFDAQQDDWIIVSDVDEIPRPELIQEYQPKKYLRADFEQRFYSYYLNNLCKINGKPVPLYGSKITTYHNLINFFYSIENFRNYKSSGLLRGIKRYFFKRNKVQIIHNGGWHFSWMGGVDSVIKKLESYAHQEYNKPEYKNREYIKARIMRGFDVINPDVRCCAQRIDNQFPKYLVDNIGDFEDWLIPYEN